MLNQNLITFFSLILLLCFIIITANLYSVISSSFYLTGNDIASASLAEPVKSGILNVLGLMEVNREWGKTNEFLIMKKGEIDLSKLDLHVPLLPTGISSDGKEKYFYYISFNRDDPVFKEKKYFSVNNIHSSSSVPGWRKGVDVPPFTADIVITLLYNNHVEHIEVIFKEVKHRNFCHEKISLVATEIRLTDKTLFMPLYNDFSSDDIYLQNVFKDTDNISSINKITLKVYFHRPEIHKCLLYPFLFFVELI